MYCIVRCLGAINECVYFGCETGSYDAFCLFACIIIILQLASVLIAKLCILELNQIVHC